MREIIKSLGCGISAIIVVLEPTFNFILICTLCVVLDCISAWMLSRRVKKKYPDKQVTAKFSSFHAKRIVSTILEIYSLIITAFLIDKYIITFYDLHLANIVAGIFCFIQLWSVLENQSSCNGSKWAKVLQKIMVDKTEKHFDIDLTEFKKNKSLKNKEDKYG